MALTIPVHEITENKTDDVIMTSLYIMLVLKPTIGTSPWDYLSNTGPIIFLYIIHPEIQAE